MERHMKAKNKLKSIIALLLAFLMIISIVLYFIEFLK